MPFRALAVVTLLLATLPAAAALTLTQPRQLTAPVIEPEFFSQSVGRIAATDAGGLVVFVNIGPGTVDVLAVRTRPDGSREDAPPILLAELTGSIVRPAVAAGGGVYLAAWSQSDGVMGRIVRPDGTVGATLRLAPSFSSAPLHVAFNGEVFLVLWSGGGAIIDPSGRVIRQFPLTPAASVDSQLVATGSVFQLVELDEPRRTGRAITARAIYADGTVAAPAPIASPNHVQSMHAAAHGSELVVAWTTIDASTGVPTAHVSRLLGGEVQTLETLTGWREEGVVADAAGILLFTSASGSLYVRRIGSPGATTVARPTHTSSLVGAVATSNGTVTLFADSFVLYTGLLEAGTYGRLVYAPRHQIAPAAAVAGALRLALWSEFHVAESRSILMAARFTADGRSLDPHGIELGNAPFGAPQVASDGTNWLVVYTNGIYLYARRVLADGTLPEAEPVVIGENYQSSGLDVDWDGTSYVVTWTAKDGSRAGFSEIDAMRIAPHGSRSTPLALTPQGYSRYPAIASSPAGSLVVWGDSYVRGALVLPSGTVVPVEFPGSFIASHSPSVAFNGSDFLVMWQRPDKLYLEWVLVSTTGVVRFPAWNTLQLNAPVTLVVSAIGDAFLFAFATPYIQVGLLSSDGYLLQPVTNVGTTSGSTLALAANQLVFGAPDGAPVRGVARMSVANVVQTPGPPKRRATKR